MKNNENLKLSESLSKELEEIREMKEWAGVNRKDPRKKNHSFRSNELGGHMELKKRKSSESICPTEDYVDNLLKSCGKKLGINYVAR